MIGLVIVLLLVLWILGYITVPGVPIPNPVLFVFNGEPITFIELLLFAVMIWAVSLLPSPLQEIAFVVLIVWVLSTFGIIAIANLASILVISLIIGLIYSLLTRGI